MQFVNRMLGCVTLVLSWTVGSADEYDDAIATLKRRYDIPAMQKLRSGPPVVDQKILTYFDELGRGRGMLPQQQLQTLMSTLAERYYFKLDGMPREDLDQSPDDLRSLTIILRLVGRNPVYAGSYFYKRGPQFYTLLLQLAKCSDPFVARAATSVLRDTALSRRSDNMLGDPALIRLFRRTQDWAMLGMLRDKESIPKMRAATKSGDRRVVTSAIAGLSLVPDYEGAPLIIPHLSDKEELEHGKQEGKFGPAYRALRWGIRPKYVPLLVKFAREHAGMARAYAVNLLGYFGTKDHIRKLQRYRNDSFPRTREAVYNATMRLQGKLPDPHDYPRWDHASKKTRRRG